MAFQDDIVAGTKLVRTSIQSPNYIAGSTGWTINRDGSAEFSNITLRGPLTVLQNGLVVASVGATGNVSGQIGTFNDIVFNDDSGVPTSLSGLSGAMARGLAGFFGTFAVPPAPGNGIYTNTGWFKAPLRGDRLYLITCTPLVCNNSAFADVQLATQWSVFDSINPVPGIFAGTQQAIVGGIGAGVVTSFLFATGGGSSRTATATFTLQSKGSTAALTFANPGGWNLMCHDVGSLSFAMNTGGTGAPAGTTQRTTLYPITASQAYQSSGAKVPGTDGTENVYQSDMSPTRPYGSERSQMIFPGATIRTDLTGATVQSAKLWLYCHAAEESAGSFGYSTSTVAAIPLTLPSPAANQFGYDDEWPLPGWHDISLLDGGGSSAINAIIAGANSFVMAGFLFGLAATGFRGFGFGGTTIPYLEITYTK